MKVNVVYGFAYRQIEILEVNETPTSPRYPNGFIRFIDDSGKERKLMIKINTKGKHFTIHRWQVYFDYADGVVTIRRG